MKRFQVSWCEGHMSPLKSNHSGMYENVDLLKMLNYENETKSKFYKETENNKQKNSLNDF